MIQVNETNLYSFCIEVLLQAKILTQNGSHTCSGKFSKTSRSLISNPSDCGSKAQLMVISKIVELHKSLGIIYKNTIKNVFHRATTLVFLTNEKSPFIFSK